MGNHFHSWSYEGNNDPQQNKKERPTTDLLDPVVPGRTSLSVLKDQQGKKLLIRCNYAAFQSEFNTAESNLKLNHRTSTQQDSNGPTKRDLDWIQREGMRVAMYTILTRWLNDEKMNEHIVLPRNEDQSMTLQFKKWNAQVLQRLKNMTIQCL